MSDSKVLFGALANMSERTSKTGKRYAAGSVIITNSAGEVLFTKSIVAFKEEAVEALLSAGNTTRMRLFGYLETLEVEGGKYTREMLKVVDARVLSTNEAADA